MSYIPGVFSSHAQEAMLPNEVYVSGMPFMLQGWNGRYQRIAKEFVLCPYVLYGTIPIIGTKIRFQNGRWCFIRDCDLTPLYYNNILEGDWSGFTVSRTESHFKKKLFFTIMILAGFALMMK